MTSTVPLSSLAASPNDNAPLVSKLLFTKDTRLLRHLEYLWGLEIHTFDPTHERSILHIRKSMENLSSGSWSLVPTQETLAAMHLLQKHNYTLPLSQRKSFLTEFSAEYEYIFVPLDTDVDFFVLQPGQDPQRLASPYDDFPRVTSSANPFFVLFYSRLHRYSAPTSEAWQLLCGSVTSQWRAFPLPEEFLMSCYPESLVSESDDESEPDGQSKSGSEETVVTPMDEGPSPVPGKEAFVSAWVRNDAGQPRESLVLDVPSSWPYAPEHEPVRSLREAVKLHSSLRSAFALWVITTAFGGEMVVWDNPRAMGYSPVWVITAMGYLEVDCIL
ncbi:hypothetical protein B0H16DRAFT_1888779 [Mycena metata]|uniref:Uncharacterized protein n=1 Tax=Mycena metata TaxID=1033252 RepID=A0AAD7N5C3_9AGAR|nr:hypothetical protein B0H16DRAFT_1888779 [Mycena metata]